MYQIDVGHNETIWVNSATGCVGRFGRMGVDIHREPMAQQDGSECLCCTHGPVTETNWRLFQTEMKRHYGVVIADSLRPSWVLPRSAGSV